MHWRNVRALVLGVVAGVLVAGLGIGPAVAVDGAGATDAGVEARPPAGVAEPGAAVDASGGATDPGARVGRIESRENGIGTSSGGGDVDPARGTANLQISGFDGPSNISRGSTYIVTAVAKNPGNTSVTSEVSYTFSGTTVATKEITVPAGEALEFNFEMSVEQVVDAGVSVEAGRTYDHSVVSAGGSEAGGEVTVVESTTTDASSITVVEFEGTTQVSRGGDVDVGVTLRNEGSSAFEGVVEYRFGEEPVRRKEVRIPAGETLGIEFSTGFGQIEDVFGELEPGTYTHGIWIGGERKAAREITVAEATTTTAPPETDTTTDDPSAIEVEAFDAPAVVRPDETVVVEVVLVNEGTATFEGEVGYRFGDTTVDGKEVSIGANEEATVTFRLEFAQLEEAVGGLEPGTYTHGISVQGVDKRNAEIRVEAREGGSNTTTAPADEETTTVDGPEEDCPRGFFTRCAGNSPLSGMNQSTLTIIGIITSIVGIVYEMVSKR